MKKTISLLFTGILLFLYIHAYTFDSKASSQVLTPEQDNLILLDRNEIINLSQSDYNENNIFRWKDYSIYKMDIHDGLIPYSHIDDSVYCSMNLPSESLSEYMISAWRDNGHIIGNTSSPESQKILGMGGIYVTQNAVLPENFSIYLGKLKVFAYSKSQNRWIIIDDCKYPLGLYIYTLPWENSKQTKCENITYSDDYVKIDLTSHDLENSVLHFWGTPVPLDKSDYLYYACAYDFWGSPNVEGKLTSVNGIDTKDITGAYTISQLYSSRGLAMAPYLKTIWGNTIPNSQYDICNTNILNNLY